MLEPLVEPGSHDLVLPVAAVIDPAVSLQLEPFRNTIAIPYGRHGNHEIVGLALEYCVEREVAQATLPS